MRFERYAGQRVRSWLAKESLPHPFAKSFGLWMNSPRMWTEKQEIRWGKDVGVERHRLREILRTKNCAILDVYYTLILNLSFTLWNSAAYTRSTQKAVP